MRLKNPIRFCLAVITAGFAGISLQAQVVVPSDFAFPESAVDTSKPGFFWNVSEVLATEPNVLSWAEAQLAGLQGQNFADPNAVGTDASGAAAPANPNTAPISFVIPTAINFSIVAGDTAHGSTNITGVTQENQMPGVPGTGGNNGTDNTASETLTYLDLPAGTNFMGVRSDDGFRVTIGGANPADVYSPQATVVGSGGEGGRSASDTTFKFVIQKAGLYAARLLYENGGGDASVQWFTVNTDGSYSLINDTNNGGIHAYRALTTASAAYASSLVPIPGTTGVAPQPVVQAVVKDGATPLDQSKIVLTFNGTVVTPSITHSGSQTTITYIPTNLLASATLQTALLNFVDGTTPRSYTWKFTTGIYVSLTSAMAVVPATNKPGFQFSIFANSANGTDQSFNNDFRDFAEQSLNMIYRDWSDQTVASLPLMNNQANPAAVGSAIGAAPALAAANAPAFFEIASTIDFNASTTPGLPALDGSTDIANGELLTYVALPAGLTTFGVTTPDLYRAYAGSWDATAGVLAAHLNVYGAPDSTFSVFAQTAGVYPLRLIWNHVTGNDPGLTLYTIDSQGKQHNLNDTASGGLATYRALAAPSEPYIKFTSPNTMLHQMVTPSYALVVNIADGDVGVDDASPALTLDGKTVTTIMARVGNVLTVTYNPTTLQIPTEIHSATLAFKDKAGKQLSETWSFMNLKAIWLPASPVKGEDFESYPGDGTVFNTPANAWSANWNDPHQPDGTSWYAFGYSHRETDSSGSNIPEDLTNPNSDSYFTFVVSPMATFGGIESDVANVQSLETLNGQPITSLGGGNILIAESDNRSGATTAGQVQFIYSKAFNLSTVANPVLAFDCLKKQNQDDLGAIEYSVDGGTNWAPVIYLVDGAKYKSDPPDTAINADGTMDAVSCMTTPHGDAPVWTDFFGNTKGGNFGDGIAAPISQALGPFIAPRINDNKWNGRTKEAVRLPLAANKSDVRLRFTQLGTCSWYFGADNIAFYDIAPSGATVPTGLPSATPGQPKFTRIAKNPNGSITVEWTGGGTLQASPTVPGTWTDVPGATSPYTFTPTPATPIIFARIKQ